MVGTNIWGNTTMRPAVIYYSYNNNASPPGQGEYILRRGGCLIAPHKGSHHARGLG